MASIGVNPSLSSGIIEIDSSSSLSSGETEKIASSVTSDVAIDYTGYYARIATALESISQTLIDIKTNMETSDSSDTETFADKIHAIADHLNVQGTNGNFADQLVAIADHMNVEGTDGNLADQLVAIADHLNVQGTDGNLADQLVAIADHLNVQGTDGNLADQLEILAAQSVEYNQRTRMVRLIVPFSNNIIVKNEKVSSGTAHGIVHNSIFVDDDSWGVANRYGVLDLRAVEGEFSTGDMVTGEKSGKTASVVHVLELSTVSCDEVTSGYNYSSLTQPLNNNQQRAMVISALKNSNSLDEFVAEISSPSTIPLRKA